MAEDHVKIGEAAKLLGVTIQTIRNWEKSGKLIPLRTGGKHRLYKTEDIKKLSVDVAMLGLAWASSSMPPQIPAEYYCERQDRFTSRINKLSIDLQTLPNVNEEAASIITLIVGEIGDNSFVHNIGNWPDLSGIFFAFDFNKKLIVIADRGRGVKVTLGRVRKDIESDIDALRVAFTEIVSGRSPEKRGNGLKVVRKIAESNNNIGLLFRSGVGTVRIPKNSGRMEITTAESNIRGTYAVISF